MSADVRSLYGDSAGIDMRQKLAATVAESCVKFEEGGRPVTGVVYVLFNDIGDYRVGWETEDCALPAAACIGIALRGLTHSEKDG